MARKILIMNEVRNGVAWWRGVGPWSNLEKSGSFANEIELVYGNTFDWADIKGAHAVFLIRPSTQDELRIIKQAKWFGTRVWLDFDDELLSVPPENPAYPFYNKPEVRAIVREALSLADCVSFSTRYLMEAMQDYCPQAYCFELPNAYDTAINYHRKPIPQGATSPIILWRGTATHHKDLLDFEEEIICASEMYPEYLWLFLGAAPWFAEKLKAKHCVTDAMNVTDYFETLGSVHSVVGIVPLTDNKFNRAKSNIAAMEIASTGANVVCPNWEEWRLPGAFNYDKQYSFAEALGKALKAGKEPNSAMMAYFNIFLSIDTINEIRLDVAKKIVRGGF